MSWHLTVHTAFDAEGYAELADDFLTELEDPAAFDEDPRFSELEALASWLEWDMVELMAWHTLVNGEWKAPGAIVDAEAELVLGEL